MYRKIESPQAENADPEEHADRAAGKARFAWNQLDRLEQAVHGNVHQHVTHDHLLSETDRTAFPPRLFRPKLKWQQQPFLMPPALNGW